MQMRLVALGFGTCLCALKLECFQCFRDRCLLDIEGPLFASRSVKGVELTYLLTAFSNVERVMFNGTCLIVTLYISDNTVICCIFFSLGIGLVLKLFWSVTFDVSQWEQLSPGIYKGHFWANLLLVSDVCRVMFVCAWVYRTSAEHLQSITLLNKMCLSYQCCSLVQR